MGQKTCFHCGEPGHIRPNCPYLAGGGARGGSSRGGYQGGNRFQALSGSSSTASAYNRSQQSRTNEPLHPSEQVLIDMNNEKPRWILSCYGHQRGGPNDLKGDASFEEVRWMQYQGKLSGTPDFQLSANFRGAFVTKDKEIKALIKADKKPSVGGMPIHEPNPWLDHITGRSSNPFGSHAGAATAQPTHLFGQQPAAPATGNPFGIGGLSPPPAFGMGAAHVAPPPAFGPGAQRAPGGAQFGQTGQLGGGFGAAPTAAAPFRQAPAFGQPLTAPAPTGILFGQPTQPSVAAPASLFGQPAQPSMPAAPTSLFGQPTQPPPTAVFDQQQQQASLFSPGPAPSSKAMFGQGASGAAAPVFGASTSLQGQQQPTTVASSTAFGVGAANPLSTNPGAAAAAAASSGVDEGDAMAQYMAPIFARGKIPDNPPPPQLCT